MSLRNDNFFVIARVIHVIGVVLWIGGVAFVTTVLIPAIRKMPEGTESLQLFEKLEERFSLQAKFVTFLTGLSGFYMVYYLNGWHLYLSASYWWLPMMTFIWLIFTLVLFVFEPLFLHRWFHTQAEKGQAKTMRLVHRFHIVLLTLSLLAIFGAVSGVRGWFH